MPLICRSACTKLNCGPSQKIELFEVQEFYVLIGVIGRSARVVPLTVKQAQRHCPGLSTALLVGTVLRRFVYHMAYVLNFITNEPFACKIVTK